MPFGNTANRPSNPTVGQTYYNGELGYQEIYTNSGWTKAVAGSGEDFTVNVGTSGNTKTDLTKNFISGKYICTSSLSDSTLDIYLLNEDGSVSGYANAATATTTIDATASFRYVVVYGATNNDTLTFQYKTVVAPTSNSTNDLLVGPRITNVATVSLPNQNDTTVVTGQNFAIDITATFTGTDNVTRNAKSIVRSSSTSLIITRPDDMPPSANPYTLTLINPGTISPTSSNAHKSINTISSGNSPVWVTTSPLHYDFGVAWNGGNLSATDADGGSSITYSVVSGSLPTGISLNSSTGALTGTPSTSQVSATVRATDSGGNFVDRTFLFNRKPVWNTTSLAQGTQGSAYSQTLSVSDDTSISSYTLVSGTLPSGLSLNTSTGVISGTPSAGNGNATLTFRATDSNGGTQDRNLSIGILLSVDFTSSTTWTAPSGVSSVTALVVAGGGGGANGSYGGHGGGGAGGVIYNTSQAVTPNQSYVITIGGGGSTNSNGTSSSFGSLISTTGGGRGGGNSSDGTNTGGKTAGDGGSGGGGAGDSGFGSASDGAWRTPGTGVSGQGNSGGNSTGLGFGGGGGGGKGSAGSGATYGNGASYTIVSTTYNVGGGGHGGTNGNNVASNIWGGGGTNSSSGGIAGSANTGGGGGGKNNNNTGAASGGSGRIVLSYVA